jgi:Bacterial membrane protein YfhO
MTRPYVSRLRIRADALAALAVALAPLAYFYPATAGQLVISPDDGVIFNVPLREAAARIFLSGSLPLWNPYVFCGMPLHAAAQAGLLFPLNWFYLAFSTPTATNLMMLSTYSVAGLGAFLYARRSGSSTAGALVTGLVWQFSAFMVCQIGHTNVAQTGAALPWVLWAVEGYGSTGSRRRGVLLAALVALQSFAGHQQTFAYSLLLVCAYALVMARAATTATRGNHLRSLALVAAGVLLSAVQIVPTFELLRNSPRAAATYDFFTSFSMPRRFLLTVFAPFLSGGGDGRLFRAPYVGQPFFGEYVTYVGVVALMLAALAFVLKADVRTKFWGAAGLVALALATGRNAPLGLYHLIYYVPVLNLFRVPARHLLEAEFALAVLAGRGLTAVAARRGETKTVRRALAVGACVFLLTCVAVTWGRPADFRLGRVAEVGVMRAPELFLPVAFALAGACAVWFFARGRGRWAAILLVALVAMDSVVWGQSSGWRVGSPKFDFDLWGEPPTVRYLRELESQRRAGDDAAQASTAADGGAATQRRGDVDVSTSQASGPYRILTEDQPFDPSLPVPPNTPGAAWVPELQPDVYEMYGVENAAGYDGFGLSRYSRLAGDMKVWGELTDPERTLRGAGRELDLLNVRYLLTRPIAGAAKNDTSTTNSPAAANGSSSSNTPAANAPSSSTTNSSTANNASTSSAVNNASGSSLSRQPARASAPAALPAPDAASDFPAATEEFGGRRFAAGDLGLPSLDAGARLSFVVPRVEADGVALLTNLSWSVDVPDGAAVARVRLFEEGGKSFDFDLRAGQHTSDWAYDRPDLRARIKHGRAPVATSYEVEDARGRYEAHTYVSSLKLPERAVVTGGEIEVVRLPGAPDLSLGVTRVSLFDEAAGSWFPLRREWLSKESAQPETQLKSKGGAAPSQTPTPTATQTLVTPPTREQLATRRWRRLAQLGDVAVFENTRALPRAWLASEARVLSEEEMLGVIRTGRLPDGGAWEPERTALVESPPDFRGQAAGDPSARAEVIKHEPNRVELKTASSAPSILVLSENHFPGWRAYVDGRAAEDLRVDYGLRGVVLPAGEHRVEFVYRPKSVLIGLVVTLFTLAALLLWSSSAASEWLARRLGKARPLQSRQTG